MWKDFFYFTKKERQGIIVLLIIVSGIWIGKWIFSKEEKTSEDSKQTKLIFPQKKINHEPEGKNTNSVDSGKKEIVLTFFDPNTADSADFVSMGIRSYIARNIIKYREKGGKFKTPEDFSKIYGLSQSDFDRLRPYIRLKESKEMKEMKKMREINEVKKDSFVYNKPAKISLGTFIEINTADTSAFKTIPNVGSGFAKRIVKYRDILGGFYSIEQLKEVYEIDENLFLKISPFLTISEDKIKIKKITVNQSSLDRLRAHPYINFYQAKAIIEIRKKKGKINDISELSLLEEFPEKDIERLKYYLSFE